MTDPMALAGWLTQAGLAGMSEAQLLDGFCKHLVAGGLPLGRAPSSWSTPCTRSTRAVPSAGSASRPERPRSREYGRTSEYEDRRRAMAPQPLLPPAADRRQPSCGAALARGDPPDFPILEELRDHGHTDYLALIHRFAAEGVIGEMDCVYSSWITDAPGGFAEAQVEALQRLVPVLALAMKCALARPGSPRRWSRPISAATPAAGCWAAASRAASPNGSTPCCGSPTCAATRGSPTRPPPEQIIPLLNDYAEAIISAIHEAGGDVLKLIGDGTLAIFQADDAGQRLPLRAGGRTLARERVAA